MGSLTYRYGSALMVSLLLVAPHARSAEDPRELPRTPAVVSEVVLSQAFVLDTGFMYSWSKNPFLVRSGTLLVLRVDPALVFPRNAAEPILYAGDHAVQRLNQGHQSGFVVALVPGEIDLALDPIWFGSPGLPERVNADTIRAERALAENAQIRALSTNQAQLIVRKRVRASGFSELLRGEIANLVLEYSPQEESLVESWRLPTARAIPAAGKGKAR